MIALPQNRYGHTAALCLVLAAAYLVLGLLAFAVSLEYGEVTSMVFLPEGVALAACVFFGPSVAPGIFLGQMALSVWSGVSLPGAALLGAINALECMLGGWLFVRLKISRRFETPRHVAYFVGLVFLVLQPLAATGGVAALHTLDIITANDNSSLWNAWLSQGLFPAWLHWWLGNASGQLVMAPLLLSWSVPAVPVSPSGNRDLIIIVGIGILLALLLALSGGSVSSLPIMALVYSLLVWLGQSYGIRGVTIANVFVVAIVTWAGVAGWGFQSQLPIESRVSNVGFLVVAACGLSLMLHAMLEERRAFIERLIDLASKDPLLQLNNRRYFMELADREMARARRDGSDLMLLMLDIDRFKQVNDRHGHAVGDQALKFIADTCLAVVRAEDIVGRVGGEEFAILLTSTSFKGGQLVAERLREQIATVPVVISDKLQIDITASIGLAPLAAGQTLDEWVRTADEALYKAKEQGRNRVVAEGYGDAAEAAPA